MSDQVALITMALELPALVSVLELTGTVRPGPSYARPLKRGEVIDFKVQAQRGHDDSPVGVLRIVGENLAVDVMAVAWRGGSTAPTYRIAPSASGEIVFPLTRGDLIRIKGIVRSAPPRTRSVSPPRGIPPAGAA